MGTPRDPNAIIELALYYRDQCLEWAALASTSDDLKLVAQRHAFIWDRLAADVRRDAKLIADSRALIAEANQLLKGDRGSGARPPTPA